MSTGGPFSCRRPSKESKSPLSGAGSQGVQQRPALTAKQRLLACPSCSALGQVPGAAPFLNYPPHTHTACTRGPARVWERGLDSHLCRQDPGRAPQAPHLPSGLGTGTAQPVGEKALPGAGDTGLGDRPNEEPRLLPSSRRGQRCPEPPPGNKSLTEDRRAPQCSQEPLASAHGLPVGPSAGSGQPGRGEPLREAAASRGSSERASLGPAAGAPHPTVCEGHLPGAVSAKPRPHRRGWGRGGLVAAPFFRCGN